MSEKEVDDERCGVCDEVTEQEYFGFVPHHMIDVGPIFSWYKAKVCLQCGSLTPLQIEEEDVESIEEDYVDFLIEKDIIDENEREKWLQTAEEN